MKLDAKTYPGSPAADSWIWDIEDFEPRRLIRPEEPGYAPVFDASGPVDAEERSPKALAWMILATCIALVAAVLAAGLFGAGLFWSVLIFLGVQLAVTAIMIAVELIATFREFEPAAPLDRQSHYN